MKWKRLPHRLLVLTNLAVALLSLLGCSAIWIGPNTFLLPSLVAVGFPLLLLANAIFMTFWLLLWRRPVWISLAALAMLSPLLGRYAQPLNGGATMDANFTFRVLTYNVNLFRLYSWSPLPPSHHEIAQLVDSLRVDAVCLQEFFTVDSVFSDHQARAVFPAYGHVHYVSSRAGRAYGLATFSRYAIVDSGHFTFPGSLNGAIFTDLDIGFDTVRLYNLHLQSFRFRAKDMALLRVPQAGDEPIWRRTLNLLSRVSNAMKQRASQVDIVRQHIDRSPHPVIVCGDFNDAPLSHTYQKLHSGLHDAFVESGRGFGTTYRKVFPAYRIDYTLYGHPFVSIESTNPEVHHSDHYPVLTTLAVHSVFAALSADSVAQPADTSASARGTVY